MSRKIIKKLHNFYDFMTLKYNISGTVCLISVIVGKSLNFFLFSDRKKSFKKFKILKKILNAKSRHKNSQTDTMAKF